MHVKGNVVMWERVQQERSFSESRPKPNRWCLHVHTRGSMYVQKLALAV